MNKNILLAGVVGLVAGLLLSPVFSWRSGPTRPGPQMMSGQTGPGWERAGNLDQHFIEQMIPHHQDAIAMAELAAKNAEHEEIKNLAANIIRAQSEENQKMQNWYQSWFGQTVPTDVNYLGFSMMGGMGRHGGMMGDTTDVARLEGAQPFDKAFIEEMIPHHQMAVMMANMVRLSSERQEIKDLAQAVVAAQTAEISQMRDWYKTWYQ